MKVPTVKSIKRATRKTSGRKGFMSIPKVEGKSKKMKKLMCGEGRISKLDAQVLVSLLRTPFQPNEATLEAQKLNESIRRLVVK